MDSKQWLIVIIVSSLIMTAGCTSLGNVGDDDKANEVNKTEFEAITQNIEGANVDTIENEQMVAEWTEQLKTHAVTIDSDLEKYENGGLKDSINTQMSIDSGIYYQSSQVGGVTEVTYFDPTTEGDVYRASYWDKNTDYQYVINDIRQSDKSNYAEALRMDGRIVAPLRYAQFSPKGTDTVEGTDVVVYEIDSVGEIGTGNLIRYHHMIGSPNDVSINGELVLTEDGNIQSIEYEISKDGDTAIEVTSTIETYQRNGVQLPQAVSEMKESNNDFKYTVRPEEGYVEFEKFGEGLSGHDLVLTTESERYEAKVPENLPTQGVVYLGVVNGELQMSESPPETSREIAPEYIIVNGENGHNKMEIKVLPKVGGIRL